MDILREKLEDLLIIWSELNRNSDSDSTYYELEIRFSRKRLDTQRIFEYISNNQFTTTTYQETSKNDEGLARSRIRKIKHENSKKAKYGRKIQLQKVVIKELMCRIVLSAEEDLSSKMSEHFEKLTPNDKKMYKYESEFWNFELKEDSHNAAPRLEIEINPKSFGSNSFTVDTRKIKSSLLDVENILVDDRVLNMIYGSKILNNFERILDDSGISEVFFPFANRFTKPISLDRSEFYNMLTKKSLYITPKINGERYFILVDKHGIVELSPIQQYELIKNTSQDFSNHISPAIFEVEKLGEKYFIFDVIMFCGVNMTNKPLKERYETLLAHKQQIKNIIPKDTEIKMYKQVDDYDSLVRTIKQYSRKIKKMIDGFLLIPIESEYQEKPVKLKYVNTVDLSAKDGHLVTSSGRIIMKIPTDPKFVVEEGKIYEVKISSKGLVLDRERNDRKRANNDQIWESTKRAIKVKDILGIGAKGLRYVSHQVKSKLINDYDHDVILDIGTGQGGDINKWNDNAQVVYCVEKNKAMCEEFSRRCRKNRSSLTNIVLIKSKLSDINNPKNTFEQKIDLITIFFCFNLLDQDDFIALGRIVKDSLKPNGRLVGIFTEGNSLSQLVNEKGKESDDDENLIILEASLYLITMNIREKMFASTIYNTYVDTNQEIMYTKEDVKKTMIECGFKNVKFYRMDFSWCSAEERDLLRTFKIFVCDFDK
eukprot:TRINITY_DN14914_c0_g1_i1.p1 TRINITY_DN14914_c0_g1~~TRINITY_DN14914_c0_g1_i1.p1  ORF type:complete len:710 (-),score=99.00 TRINITY_DN14914_c0_g1_i1:36-2165(-)